MCVRAGKWGVATGLGKIFLQDLKYLRDLKADSLMQGENKHLAISLKPNMALTSNSSMLEVRILARTRSTTSNCLIDSRIPWFRHSSFKRQGETPELIGHGSFEGNVRHKRSTCSGRSVSSTLSSRESFAGLQVDDGSEDLVSYCVMAMLEHISLDRVVC